MAKMTETTRNEKVSLLTSVLGDSVPVQITEKSFRLALDAFTVEEVSLRSLDAFLLGVQIGKKLSQAEKVQQEATEEATEEVQQPKTRKKAGK